MTSEIYHRQNIQTHSRTWLAEGLETFESPLAGTLTFKYGVSELYASRQLKRLHHHMSKYTFGNSYNRHKKMIRCIALEEGFTNDNRHFHIIVDSHHKPIQEFMAKLEKFWIKQGRSLIEPLVRNGNWLDYITKLKSKSAIYGDSLMLDSTNF